MPYFNISLSNHFPKRYKDPRIIRICPNQLQIYVIVRSNGCLFKNYKMGLNVNVNDMTWPDVNGKIYILTLTLSTTDTDMKKSKYQHTKKKTCKTF